MRRAAVLAIFIALVRAGSAAAGDVRVEAVYGIPDRQGDPSHAYVLFRGGPGEANAVTVTGGREALVVRDAGAPLRPGAGCRALGEHEVECRSVYPPLTNLVLYGEDGDDALADAAPWIYASLLGGPGDDVLTGDDDSQGIDGGDGADRIDAGGGMDDLQGGAGSDEVHGGADPDEITGDPPGATGWPDVLDGGPGDYDRVSYGGRTTGVVVDLAVTGPQGEGDVLTEIEDASGGEAADVIRGDDGPNRLSAAGRGDLLQGRGGSDQLTGGPGDDRLEGGPGNDRLWGGAGLDRHLGGPGADRLNLDLARFLDPSGRADARMRCGPGRDVAALPDATAYVPRDCEIIEFELLEVRVQRAGPRRLALVLQHPRDVIPFCRVTARVSPSLARRTVRMKDNRPHRVVLQWPRPAARATVSLRGAYRCGARTRVLLGAFGVA